jgi:glycerol-3-phosphate acyltransferase PlsX
MVRIAVDAMGGDYAPREVVHGAVLAAREYGVTVQLVGSPDAINAELKRYTPEGLDIVVVPASEVVGMDENPARAVAKKKDSSIVVATRQAAEGKADAVVTAGSTGAAVAASRFYLGRLEGVSRAPIAALMPTVNGLKRPCIMMDAGAYHDAEPQHLQQFAIMGIILSESLFKVSSPKVGILNIGTEETKGTETVRQAYKLLRSDKRLNFQGFVEGRDFPLGKVDVLVTDGFSGNVALKTAEGIAKMISVILRQELYASPRTKAGGWLAAPAFDGLKRRTDYNEFGGALLIGLKSVFVKAHGGSKHTAIKNAIRSAHELVDANVVKQIEWALSSVNSGTSPPGANK